MKKIQHKTLIVDDDERWSKSIMAYLKRFAHLKNFYAPTFKDALKLVKEEAFDVAIIDYDLGGGNDGIELLRNIKTGNFSLPVIVVSNVVPKLVPNKMKDILIDMIHYEVSDYLIKNDENFNRKLRESIEDCISKRPIELLGLESWIETHQDPDKVMLITGEGEEYTARQLLDEIKKDTDFGKEKRIAISQLLYDLISRKRREI